MVSRVNQTALGRADDEFWFIIVIFQRGKWWRARYGLSCVAPAVTFGAWVGMIRVRMVSAKQTCISKRNLSVNARIDIKSRDLRNSLRRPRPGVS